MIKVPQFSKSNRLAWLVMIFFLGFGFMLYQLSMLRELRFQISSIFLLTPILFGIILLLIGIGAIFANTVKRVSLMWIKITLLILPIIILPSFYGLIKMTQAINLPVIGSGYPGWTVAEYVKYTLKAIFIIMPVSFGIIFFLQGVLFALLYKVGREEGWVSHFYTIDLLSSGVGMLVAGIFTIFIQPVNNILVSAISLLIAYIISIKFIKYNNKYFASGILLSIAVIGVAMYTGILKRIETPEQMKEKGVKFSIWTPYQRIDILNNKNTIEVYTDRFLFYSLLKPDKTPKKPLRFVTNIINDSTRLLIIGSGVGDDVREIRMLGSKKAQITTVEIEKGFIKLSKKIPWMWKYYSTAHIINKEGRYFLETTNKKFDIIFYAMLDPKTAISNAVLPLVNFLYTYQGIEAAYKHLNPNGVLVIRRVYLNNKEGEFTKKLCATLRYAGIKPEQIRLFKEEYHFPVAPFGITSCFTGVIFKNPEVIDKFTSNEWKKGAISVKCEEGEMPVSDAHPISLIPENMLKVLLGHRYYQSLVIIGILLILIVGYLIYSRDVMPVHFFLLGISYMLFESRVLFDTFLLIGNPALSTAIGVGTFLIGNSIGAYLSDRFEMRKKWLFLLPVLVALYLIFSMGLVTKTLGVPQIYRILLYMIYLLLPGIMIGTIFPISLNFFKDKSVPSMYAIDLIGMALGPFVFSLMLLKFGVTSITYVIVIGYITTIFILNKGK